MKLSTSIAVACLAVLTPLPALATAPMTQVRWLHTLTRMENGRLLAAGGYPAGKTAEIYDLGTDSWKATKTEMIYDHQWHLATTLCDGRVLVAGQSGGGSHKAELYIPSQDKWSPAVDMIYSHVYGASVVFPAPDCRVMLIGGFMGNYWGELYDPATSAFTDGGGAMNHERFFHTATLLPDGRVLAVGGGINAKGTWLTTATADMYDPAARTWTKLKPMKSPRRGHSATLLPDGRVLVAGGTTGGSDKGTDGGKQLDTTEIYDPKAEAWTPGPPLNTARTLHTAVLLPSGVVLLLGGLDATASATRQVEGYLDGSWQVAPPLEADRFLHAAVLLDDGSVFLTGGLHQASTEIYRTTDLGVACANGVTCTTGFCVGGVCCNEACTDGCRKCDVPGREGTCSAACADGSHVLGCADGSASCALEACEPRSCGSFACDAEAGACHAGCTSVDECAPGYGCDVEGRCVAPPAVTDGESACAVESPAREGSEGVGVLGAVAAAALMMRRRRRAPVSTAS